MFIIFEEISKAGIKHVLCGGSPSQIIQQYQDINELNKLCYDLHSTGNSSDGKVKREISNFLEKYYADELSEKDIINFSFCTSIYSHKVLNYCLTEEDLEKFIKDIKTDIQSKDENIQQKYDKFLSKLQNSFKDKEDYKYVLKHMGNLRIIKDIYI